MPSGLSLSGSRNLSVLLSVSFSISLSPSLRLSPFLCLFLSSTPFLVLLSLYLCHFLCLFASLCFCFSVSLCLSLVFTHTISGFFARVQAWLLSLQDRPLKSVLVLGPLRDGTGFDLHLPLLEHDPVPSHTRL